MILPPLPNKKYPEIKKPADKKHPEIKNICPPLKVSFQNFNLYDNINDLFCHHFPTPKSTSR